MLGKVPLAQALLRVLEDRHRRRWGKEVPYDRLYWRPPLHPRAAFEVETGQIRDTLRLQPLVSITDHDNIDACTELRALNIAVPFSHEWTVLYQSTVFHLGVHNLPPDDARDLFDGMKRITAAPRQEGLLPMLQALDAMPDVLLVLNHPLSSEMRAGFRTHARLLQRFLREYGRYMHALELNGLQPHSHNRSVARMAADDKEPAFGAAAVWIPAALQNQALASGYAVVDQTSVLATHLAEVVKQHAYELLTRQETKRLLDRLAESHPKLVEELVPKVLSLGEVQKTLQQLLREQVSVRDLSTILETLLDIAPSNKNPVLLVESARQALGRALVRPLLSESGGLRVVTLDRALERSRSRSRVTSPAAWIPYGTIQRPTMRNNSWEKAPFEVPAMRWADLSGAGADGKFHRVQHS